MSFSVPESVSDPPASAAAGAATARAGGSPDRAGAAASSQDLQQHPQLQQQQQQELDQSMIMMLDRFSSPWRHYGWLALRLYWASFRRVMRFAQHWRRGDGGDRGDRGDRGVSATSTPPPPPAHITRTLAGTIAWWMLAVTIGFVGGIVLTVIELVRQFVLDMRAFWSVLVAQFFLIVEELRATHGAVDDTHGASSLTTSTRAQKAMSVLRTRLFGLADAMLSQKAGWAAPIARLIVYPLVGVLGMVLSHCAHGLLLRRGPHPQMQAQAQAQTAQHNAAVQRAKGVDLAESRAPQ